MLGFYGGEIWKANLEITIRACKLYDNVTCTLPLESTDRYM